MVAESNHPTERSRPTSLESIIEEDTARRPARFHVKQSERSLLPRYRDK